jgi:hypothetical protein
MGENGPDDGGGEQSPARSDEPEWDGGKKSGDSGNLGYDLQVIRMMRITLSN